MVAEICVCMHMYRGAGEGREGGGGEKGMKGEEGGVWAKEGRGTLTHAHAHTYTHTQAGKRGLAPTALHRALCSVAVFLVPAPLVHLCLNFDFIFGFHFVLHAWTCERFFDLMIFSLLRGNGAFLYMDALGCWNLFEYDDSNKSCAGDL